MDFITRHWYLLVGISLGVGWILLFLNRHRIESPWLRSVLGLSWEDPLMKAAMQGRKDFTKREMWGWLFVILLMIMGPLLAKYWF